MVLYKPLAIIMTICNDFVRKSAESAVKQRYPGELKIYFFDDSSQQQYLEEIDLFCHEHPQVILIRRETRKDYKAGNLNNGLFKYVKEPYFIQIDADQMLPDGYAVRLYEKLVSLPDDIWFVQCAHYQNSQDGFARDIGQSFSYMWKIFLKLKNTFGFVPNFGHGVIFRRNVFEQIGGYLPLVAEDLTISAVARMHGFKGYYETEIASGEDFPTSYESFHKQQYKYVTGAIEFYHKIFRSFAKSRKVSLLEKIDVAVSYSFNLLPAMVLLYILFYTIILPLISSELLMLNIAPGITLPLLVPDASNRLLSLPFYIFTAAMLFAPMLPVALDLFSKRWLMTLRMIILSTPIYIARMVPCFTSIMKYILFKEAEFITTGESNETGSIKKDTSQSFRVCVKNKVSRILDIRGGNVYRLKLILGLIIAFFSLRTINFVILSYALSLIISYLIYRFGWENRVVRVLCYFPFAILLFSVLTWGILELV